MYSLCLFIKLQPRRVLLLLPLLLPFSFSFFFLLLLLFFFLTRSHSVAQAAQWFSPRLISQWASMPHFFFFHLPFPLGWESIPAWERSVPSRVWPLLSRLLKDCVFSLRSVASNWNESHSHLKGFSKHRTLGLTLESGVEPTSQPAFQSSRPLLRLLLVWRSQVSNNGHSAAVVSFYCILKFERIKKEKNTHPRYPGYNLEQLYQNFRH